jgi:glycosyltransferase involved in cell wall biosynthesis
MLLDALAVAAMLCTLSPAILFCMNLRQYQPPMKVGTLALPPVSVLIPARDEEQSIEAAVVSVLASRGIAFEIIVMDDGSTDQTAALVQRIAATNSRVRLEHAPALATGWNGKQHACWALAHKAQYDLLCFMDADVRLEPEALASMVSFQIHRDAGLVSGFPRQVTETWMEWLLLPLIHFVLLGFLPISRMRAGTDPACAAGCGQFLLAKREAYAATGGHAAIKATMHDGLLLPKLFRLHGYRTDIADLTGLARCRMYINAQQVWQGLAKNATEGIATPTLILPITMLLFAGQILPFLLAIWIATHQISRFVLACVVVALCGAWLPRLLAIRRFQQNWRGAVLHPVAILVLLAVQWYAFIRKLSGGAASWKNRTYSNQ